MFPCLPEHGLPWYTLLVNVSGSLLIGILIAGGIQGYWHSLAVIGFCGGFTTFSAFSLELLRLLKGGYYSTAGIYILLSVALSLGAAILGYWIATKIWIVK